MGGLRIGGDLLGQSHCQPVHDRGAKPRRCRWTRPTATRWPCCANVMKVVVPLSPDRLILLAP